MLGHCVCAWGHSECSGGSPCWGDMALHTPISASNSPRHLFAIANVAYSKVMDAKHNQCIVIRWDTAVPHPIPALGWSLISTALITSCRMLLTAWPGPMGALGLGCWVYLLWMHPLSPAQLVTAPAMSPLCVSVGRAAQGRPRPPS